MYKYICMFLNMYINVYMYRCIIIYMNKKNNRRKRYYNGCRPRFTPYRVVFVKNYMGIQM